MMIDRLCFNWVNKQQKEAKFHSHGLLAIDLLPKKEDVLKMSKYNVYSMTIGIYKKAGRLGLFGHFEYPGDVREVVMELRTIDGLRFRTVVPFVHDNDGYIITLNCKLDSDVIHCLIDGIESEYIEGEFQITH